MTNAEAETSSGGPSGAEELLLRAGGRLFARRGYAAVTTREIAREAGVNLGLIQYHFGSKEKLFLASVRRLMSDCAGKAAACHLVPAPETAEAAGRAIGEFIRAFLSCLLGGEEPEGSRLMYREAMDEGNPAGLRLQLVELFCADVTRPLLDCLAAALRPLRPDLPRGALELAGHSILGQCTYYLSNRPFLELLWRDDLGRAGVVDRIAAQVTAFSLGGLASFVDRPGAAGDGGGWRAAGIAPGRPDGEGACGE